jgi:hypothetical protein
MLESLEGSLLAIHLSKRATLATWSLSYDKTFHVNQPSANWVNHLQPLYIAGTVFDVAITPGHEDGVISILKSGRTRRMDLASTGSSSSVIGDSEDARSPCKHSEFAAEKIALLGHLAKIERETGWKTSDRAKDLRILWGLEN